MSKRHPSPSLPHRELFQLRPTTVVRHGLDKLSGYIDFEAFRPRLDELCRYSEKGRPHYDVVVMFRILILQTLYDLSDEDTEYCICDRRSFQDFVGLRGVDDIPEHTRDIYADSAYMSARREAALKAAKKRPHIVKRKTRNSPPLTGRQKYVNHVKGGIPTTLGLRRIIKSDGVP